MRITIGYKIFAVAGFLLALTTSAAFLSTSKVRDASIEVGTVARNFLPLTGRIAHVQGHLLEQEVIVQQIRHDFDVPGAHGRSIEDHLAAFGDLGDRVDDEIAAALGHAQEALAAAPDEQTKLELTRLISDVQALERQHQDIHDLVLRSVQAYRAGKKDAVEVLIVSFDRAQAKFDGAVASLVANVLSFGENSARRADVHAHQTLQFNVVVTAAAVALGLLFAAVLTRGLVRPVRRLRDGTQAIENGDLTREIEVTTNDEIADLARSFNHMLEGLRAREQLKAMFGTYLDPRVVETMLTSTNGEESVIDGVKKQVTVFFSDIAGFTPIGERLSPVGLVRLINEYLALASTPIVDNKGVIDKYIGDAVMAFWCDPFVAAGHEARLACRAALAQFDQLAVLRERLPDVTGLRKDLPEVEIRIGLATGEALVGSIGSDYAKNFTVMGDTVNLGSRLEGANKVYGTRILVCEQTWAAAADAVEMREIDVIAVAGKSEPMRIFELLSLAGGLAPAEAALRDHFEAALAAYRARDWASAESGFAACLEQRPDDGPAQVFLERVARLREAPPADVWDGVWRFTEK